VPDLIPTPTTIPVPGGKIIDEHVGRVNTGTEAVSVAHMKAPGDWTEPFQTPAFDEVTLVLAGAVLVDHDGGQLRVEAGQSVITRAGERIRYSTGAEGAEYVAVCLPAFSPNTVNREDEAGDAPEGDA
jgi:mannose-6-phosphate isomerase-like protein (cupin superfamily)